MNIITARTIKRLNVMILFFSILILMLNIFLPLVSIKNPADSTQTQYFNLYSMKYSDNEQLKDFEKDIDNINLYLWVIVIIGLLSFVGLIIKISNKLSFLSNILLIIGCINIVFCSLSCIYYMFFVKNVIDSTGVLLATIIGPLRVSYISLIIFILLLLTSVAYSSVAIPSFLRDFKKSKKQREAKDKKVISKKIVKSSRTDEKKEVLKTQSDRKKYEMRKWQTERLKDFNETSDKQKDETEKLLFSEPLEKTKEEKIEQEPEPVIETQKQTKEETESKTPFPQENIEKSQTKQLESKAETSEDAKVSESFEKALTSAIDKKKGIPTDTKTEEKQISPQKFNVKCPQCSYIFEAEKNPAGVTKIKCPKCDKEGIIK